ncbi:hypothetical protein HAX54_050269 [Datura stramonium]|uniref:Uncharacterized protein n=1 Tax=Datura stramonium TaxID=4076 RepID=A0ABS8WQ46_DATST|nr:hypothetical protein [Datura stramonium]
MMKVVVVCKELDVLKMKVDELVPHRRSWEVARTRLVCCKLVFADHKCYTGGLKGTLSGPIDGLHAASPHLRNAGTNGPLVEMGTPNSEYAGCCGDDIVRSGKTLHTRMESVDEESMEQDYECSSRIY